jgi:hypothetical protein
MSMARLGQNQAKKAKKSDRTAAPAAITLMIRLPERASAISRVMFEPISTPKDVVSIV